MKLSIALLLAIYSSCASAQAVEPADNLQKLLLKLRACVRTNAPVVQAAGAKNANEAIDLLLDTCEPQSIFLGVATNARTGPGKLSLDDFKDVGPMPPGTLRKAANEEWAGFIEATRPR
jgi:hypothetical protein